MKNINRSKQIVSMALLIITVSLCNVANAQSLDNLLRAGRQNNKKLQSLAYKHQEHDAMMVQRELYPAPSIGLQLNQVPFTSGNPLRDAFSQNLSISQMIPLGGKLSAMVAAEHSGLPGIHAEIADAEIQLDAAISMNYIKWAAAIQKHEVLSENEVLLNSLAEFTKARYNSSSQTENDLLLLQSEAAINRTQLALTDQEIKAQKTMLERYTGLSGLTRPDTAVLNMPNHVLSDEEIVRLLDEENPKLRQMEAMMAMNSGEAAANDKELIPDLMVEAMFMRMPQGMQLTTKTSPDMITGNGTTEYMYTLGASITLPFLPWTRKGIEAKTETLLFANKRIELEKNDMREEMLAQIRNAFARSAALAENEKTYREQVLPALEEAGDSAVRLYRSGNAGITKALEIRKMLLMEKMNYLMILEEEKMANIEAGMMLGISLDERN